MKDRWMKLGYWKFVIWTNLGWKILFDPYIFTYYQLVDEKKDSSLFHSLLLFYARVKKFFSNKSFNFLSMVTNITISDFYQFPITTIITTVIHPHQQSWKKIVNILDLLNLSVLIIRSILTIYSLHVFLKSNKHSCCFQVFVAPK